MKFFDLKLVLCVYFPFMIVCSMFYIYVICTLSYKLLKGYMFLIHVFIYVHKPQILGH